MKPIQVAMGKSLQSSCGKSWKNVVCSTEDFLLWAGCGVMPTEESLEDYYPDIPPKVEDVVWHAFTQVEVPVFKFISLIKKVFGQLDTYTPLQELAKNLLSILKNSYRIKFSDEPDM